MLGLLLEMILMSALKRVLILETMSRVVGLCWGNSIRSGKKGGRKNFIPTNPHTNADTTPLSHCQDQMRSLGLMGVEHDDDEMSNKSTVFLMSNRFWRIFLTLWDVLQLTAMGNQRLSE